MSQSPSAGPIVFTDADNTLWDTDGLFARAQLQLLAGVETRAGAVAAGSRLDFIRQIDQSLAQRHHLGLRYPPRMLAVAAGYALQGTPVEQAVVRAWNDIGMPHGFDAEYLSRLETEFIAAVRQQPPALPGVLNGLKHLNQAGARVFVVSEGDKGKVVSRLKAIGAADYVDRVIEAPKSAVLFRRVKRLARSTAPSWMIGDQLTRDILPAQDAGLKTVYIPSRFRPKWELAASGIKADYSAVDFAQAASLIFPTA